MAKEATPKTPVIDTDAIIAEAIAKAEEKASEAAAKIIKDAEEKAASILNEAQPKTVRKGPSKEELEKSNELVEVYLFKDDNLYKDDVTVGVNGEMIKIQRGKKVMIPRKFKEVLDNSIDQDAHAVQVADGFAEGYAEAEEILK